MADIQTVPYVGLRHVREDGRECFCGCQWVVGREGVVMTGDEAEKLAACGFVYVDFPADEYHGPITIAYDVPVPA